MGHLEKDKALKEKKDHFKSIPKNNFQLSLFEMDPKFTEAKQLLDQIDINAISPIEALLKLHEIKKRNWIDWIGFVYFILIETNTHF